ncbi:TerB family tellurite resistance protein [Pleurocapsa sp. PCC 7319]|uniref:TerB family tellurite resistance protein n=1 Tax=Pleurocapsa sp. PCC 7319 TaxID=118161 RepID=UPI00034B11C6|nr:TerB family tellurite resistance protein [Pleurocapsa sp. PCC 7319]
MTTTVAPKEGLSWLFREKFTFKELPNAQSFDGYFKSLLICVNGDDQLTSQEREWVVGYAAAYGASDSLIEELKSYAASEDIDQIVSQNKVSDSSRRYLIYDAIQACGADGEYSEPEQATVIKMAAKLGIPERVVNEIESIYLEEAKLREKRLAFMYPSGTPI